MKITFYQRGNTIYSRVYHDKNMIRVSTGIKVPSHVKFLPSRETFAGSTPDVGELNVDLSRQRVVLTQLFAKHSDLERVKSEYTSPVVDYDESDEGFQLTTLLDRYLKLMIDGKLKTKKNTRFKTSTIVTYQFAQRSYEQFASEFGTIDLRELDLSGKDLREKKQLAERFSSHFENLTDWMIDRHFAINTRSDVTGILGFCIKYWADELFLTLPKLTRPSRYETPIVTLPEDFVSAFLTDKHRMYNKFTPEDKYLWEMTAVMLITSLRISDAVAIKPYHIQFDKGRALLVKENKKTGNETTLPLPELISERLRYNIDNYGRVYSIDRSGTNYTRRKLSEFLAKYPEMHKLYRYSRRNYLGEQVEISGKLCDLVHPHMLRKTAITTMLSYGVSAQHVRFASGHSEKSQSFNRYVGFVEKRHKSEVESYYQKMLS